VGNNFARTAASRLEALQALRGRSKEFERWEYVKVYTVATSLEVGFLSLFFWGRLLSERSAAFVFLVAPQ
jgi:hypothetical protein